MPTEDRKCEGWGCGRISGPLPVGTVRYDHVSKKWLCNECWAKVDPTAPGYLKPDAK